MKNIYIAIFIYIAGTAIICFSSCNFDCIQGSGHLISQTGKIDAFTRLEVSAGIKINLKQDSSSVLKITADDNLLKHIKISVENGVLHISSKTNICNKNKIVIDLGIRNLEEIRSSGEVEIVSIGKINTRDLHVKLAGASKVTLDLDAAHVYTRVGVVSELILKGKAQSCEIDLSGSSKILALNFLVNNYNVETAGMGYCEIYVLDSLNAHSEGPSEIKYKGNPKVINREKSGVSSIDKFDK
jgi:hypothetical protein